MQKAYFLEGLGDSMAFHGNVRKEGRAFSKMVLRKKKLNPAFLRFHFRPSFKNRLISPIKNKLSNYMVSHYGEVVLSIGTWVQIPLRHEADWLIWGQSFSVRLTYSAG